MMLRSLLALSLTIFATTAFLCVDAAPTLVRRQPIGPMGAFGPLGTPYDSNMMQEQTLFTKANVKKAFRKVKNLVGRMRGTKTVDSYEHEYGAVRQHEDTSFDFLDTPTGSPRRGRVIDRLRPSAHIDDRVFSDDSDGDEIREVGIAMQPLRLAKGKAPMTPQLPILAAPDRAREKGKGIVIAD